jgi:hypothetical protein
LGYFAFDLYLVFTEGKLMKLRLAEYVFFDKSPLFFLLTLIVAIVIAGASLLCVYESFIYFLKVIFKKNKGNFSHK